MARNGARGTSEGIDRGERSPAEPISDCRCRQQQQGRKHQQIRLEPLQSFDFFMSRRAGLDGERPPMDIDARAHKTERSFANAFILMQGLAQ